MATEHDKNVLKFIKSYLNVLIKQKAPMTQKEIINAMASKDAKIINYFLNSKNDLTVDYSFNSSAGKYAYLMRRILVKRDIAKETYVDGAKVMSLVPMKKGKDIEELAKAICEKFDTNKSSHDKNKHHLNLKELPTIAPWFVTINKKGTVLMDGKNNVVTIPIGKKANIELPKDGGNIKIELIDQ